FERLRSAPDRAHLGYHGGRLVNSVLRLIDWCRAMRSARQLGVSLDLLLRHRRGRGAMGVRLPWVLETVGLQHRSLLPASVHGDHRRVGFAPWLLPRRRFRSIGKEKLRLWPYPY